VYATCELQPTSDWRKHRARLVPAGTTAHATLSMGNERSGPNYETRLPEFCRAMEQVDTTIELLSSYPTAEVLKRAGAWLDFVAPHHYDCANLAGVEADLAAIRRLLRQLGIKPPGGRVGARPYEFRHAFAVHRLTAWANDGIDIHTKLPSLSAYLGHQNIIGTEVYLRATPQLLELASTRFEQHLRDARPPE
jgi:integrase